MAKSKRYLDNAEIWEEAQKTADPKKEKRILIAVYVLLAVAATSTLLKGWEIPVSQKAEAAQQITRGR